MVRKKTSSQDSPEGYTKMWLTEWLEVTKHSRASVLKLLSEDVKLYDIRPHAKIRVQLQIMKNAPKDESEKSS